MSKINNLNIIDSYIKDYLGEPNSNTLGKTNSLDSLDNFDRTSNLDSQDILNK